MKNSSKRTLKVSANHSAKTFTLRYTYEGGEKLKYRTIQMSKEEFNNCLYNTDGDWAEFLKSNDYYNV